MSKKVIIEIETSHNHIHYITKEDEVDGVRMNYDVLYVSADEGDIKEKAIQIINNLNL